MYTGNRRTEEIEETEEDGVFENTNFAEGLIYMCNQFVLQFGINRRTPTRTRPVVTLRKDAQFIVVLPCTSKNRSNHRYFFELTPDRAMWKTPPQNSSFAYYRFESVSAKKLRRKIGTLSHPTRIDLIKWLKELY